MLRPAVETPAQKAHQENPMNNPHYIGFDVHKKTISFCVKTAAGKRQRVSISKQRNRKCARSRGCP